MGAAPDGIVYLTRPGRQQKHWGQGISTPDCEEIFDDR